jgi:hypothetical protein
MRQMLNLLLWKPELRQTTPGQTKKYNSGIIDEEHLALFKYFTSREVMEVRWVGLFF